MWKKVRAAALVVSLFCLCVCFIVLRAEPKRVTTKQAADLSVASYETKQQPSDALSHTISGETEELRYARSRLSENEKLVYDVLCGAIAAHVDVITDLQADNAIVQRAIDAIGLDCPEYFWFGGEGKVESATFSDGSTVSSCTFHYALDEEASRQAQQVVDSYRTDCLQGSAVQTADSDYQRVLAVYDYIIEHGDYDTACTDQSMYSLIHEGKGVCAGYAKTLEYLLHELGIPCVLVTGKDLTGGEHTWNLVYADGNWYQMDITWGDPLDENGVPAGTTSYTYFLLTDEEMDRTHTPDGGQELPACTATADNYYVRNGQQMATWDYSTFLGILQRSIAAVPAGSLSENVTVRFSKEAAYATAKEALIDGKQLLQAMRTSARDSGILTDSVSYDLDDTMWEIGIHLSFDGTEGDA